MLGPMGDRCRQSAPRRSEQNFPAFKDRVSPHMPTAGTWGPLAPDAARRRHRTFRMLRVQVEFGNDQAAGR